MSDKLGTTEQQSVESIKQVGGVRGYRLRRDLKVDGVYDVAQLSTAELQQITSIGPVRAEQISSHANQLVDEWRAENTASKEHRVAVVAGEESFDELRDPFLEVNSGGDLIEDALEEANVIDEDGKPTRERTRLATVAGEGMGGEMISLWISMKQSLGSPLMSRIFETPWAKYARILDPLRFVDDDYLDKHDITEADELPAGRTPERPQLKDIPFDIGRLDHVSWGMAPAERTARMVSWADEVVIVLDGDYAEFFRSRCDQMDVKCTTKYDVSSGYPLNWKPDDDDPDLFEPDEDESVRGEGGAREGSVMDLASDDFFRDGPNDVSEDRVENDPDDLTKADAGGTGVGSMSQRWG